jgi:hypothetical protein
MRQRWITLVIVGVLGVPAAGQARQADDAYLDAGARELVRLGRERRQRVDRSIDHYTTMVEERISAGLRTLGRERLFYRREVASSIDWRKDGPVRIEMLGAREVIPPVMRNAQVPTDLRGFMPHLAFDPVENDVFIRFDTTFLRHPLAADAEQHYRFRSGDTTTIRLPDGRTVQLYELVIIPRRDDVQLLSGSFWFDSETHGVVRAVFRPARAWDYDRDKDEDDDAPGFLKPIRGELLYITIEYGLWEFRWWLPRVIAAEGVFQASFLSMPMRYERRYSNYTVEGDTTGAAIMAADSLPVRPCRVPMSVTVRVGNPDSATVRRRADRARARADSIRARIDSVQAVAQGDTTAEQRRRCRERFEVVMPADTASLLNSRYLPPSIYSDDVELLTATELGDLKQHLEDLPEVPWQLRPMSFAWGLGAANMLRYNRVEALSIGANTGLDLGRLRLEAGARIGIADREPNGELAIVRETPERLWRLSGFRRLAAANPETRPLSFGNSVNALFFGRDDGEYYRTAGMELSLRPGRARTQSYDLRLYAEHQTAAETETDFSLVHALNSDHVFGPNIEASPADQFGAELALRFSRGLDPAGFRWGAEVAARAETGDFEFVRPMLTLRTALPLGPLALALESAAGTSFGTLPIQSECFLGGPATLRGYDGGVTHGLACWRARAELSGKRAGARITLFSDAGWAGARDAFGTGDALVSAGAGAAFFDGLIRFDLARALRRPTGWRLDLYVSRGL